MASKQSTRPPVYEVAAQQIRELIAEEGLEAGDRMPTERDLAVRLGISRASVRQALTLLRSQRLIEARQGDGTYLREATPTVGADFPEELQSLPRTMEVREALETHVARLAARRRSQEDLRALGRAVAAMAAAVEGGSDPSEADADFHAAIAHAADNPMLEALMQQLAPPIAQTRAASLARPGRPPRSLEGHRRILEAIAARNEEGAGAAMREHLMLVADVAHVPATAAQSTAL